MMMTKLFKNLARTGAAFAALGVLASPLSAVTVFLTDENAAASAAWDTWQWGEFGGAAGESGPQGLAQSTTTNEISFVSTGVTTKILFPITPPGGLYDSGDRFYAAFGGFEWTVNATFTAPVKYVRISYSLVGASQGPTLPFDNAPSLDVPAETLLTGGSYTTGANTVFFMDFELTDTSDTIAATFGDVIPNSHRSLDAIQIEGFTSMAPSVIPEPSTYAFIAGIGMLALTISRRRIQRVD